MIDLHCHLLPGIDDGARDAEQALALAQMAVEDGISHAVLTPHIHLGRYDNSLASIHRACNDFRALLARHEIPLQVGYAAEVHFCTQILDWVPEQKLPLLGHWEGDGVVLLELPHSHIPVGVEELVGWLIKHRIRPMIAHPERNRDVLRSFEKLLPLANLGCLFQVTAGSVAGQFGEPARLRAVQLLEQGLVTVLATDAHHEVRRPPNLAEGRRAAEAIVGESASWDLVQHNPLRIAACHFPLKIASPATAT